MQIQYDDVMVVYAGVVSEIYFIRVFGAPICNARSLNITECEGYMLCKDNKRMIIMSRRRTKKIVNGECDQTYALSLQIVIWIIGAIW